MTTFFYSFLPETWIFSEAVSLSSNFLQTQTKPRMLHPVCEIAQSPSNIKPFHKQLWARIFAFKVSKAASLLLQAFKAIFFLSAAPPLWHVSLSCGNVRLLRLNTTLASPGTASQAITKRWKFAFETGLLAVHLSLLSYMRCLVKYVARRRTTL